MATGMKIDHLNPQLFTSLQFNKKRIAGFLKLSLFRMAQVDEITVVWNNGIHREPILRASLPEAFDIIYCKRLCFPLSLIFGEKGKTSRSDFMSPHRYIFHTSGCTHMCSNVFHSKSFYFVL